MRYDYKPIVPYSTGPAVCILVGVIRSKHRADSKYFSKKFITMQGGFGACFWYLGFAEKIKLNNIATWYFCSVC